MGQPPDPLGPERLPILEDSTEKLIELTRKRSRQPNAF
jgi:hypothetical protein